MDDPVNRYIPYLVPFIVATAWVGITTLLHVFSGWYALMRKYPNSDEKDVLRLDHQSGLMGSFVGFNHVLTLSVCASGLRVGMVRLFGLFCRDFFVPWNDISCERKDWFFWRAAELRFGNPLVGKLSISAHVANWVARSARGRLPEAGPFPKETNAQIRSLILKQWAVLTIFAASIFTIASRVEAPGPALPIEIATLFPAFVIGAISVFRYFARVYVNNRSQ
jgi:hypothetical protein